MKKYLVSCIAVLTFGLMFAWLALAFFKVDVVIGVASSSGYDVLNAGTSKYASSAANAHYVFLLLSVIVGALAVVAACGASLKACGVLKVKCNLNIVVACVLALAALLALVSMICGFCVDVKIGAGLIIYPAWIVLGAVSAFLFRQAK